MQVNITSQFFSEIDNLYKKVATDPLADSNSVIRSFISLVTALPLTTNISISDLEILLDNTKIDEVNSSLKWIILKSLIKEQKLKIKEQICNEINGYHSYYFSHDAEFAKKGGQYGVFARATEKAGNENLSKFLVSDLPIGQGWKDIEALVPPSNALFIIDKYIFKPASKKIESLLSFIQLYKGETKIPYHVSIVFSADLKTSSISSSEIESCYNRIVSLGNIELQLLCDNRLSESDRIFFTNYASGNIGHPFDDRKTHFNQNFLGAATDKEGIRNNYRRYIATLKRWKEIIDKIPLNIGLMQTRWESSVFTNRLFEVIKS